MKTKQLTLSLFLLMLCTYVSADEFKIKEFQKISNDISSKRYPKNKVNDEKRALIKVRTDLKNVKFDARAGVEGSVDFKNGEYWVYVSPGERSLRIIKEGFITREYEFEEKIEASTVYSFILTGSENFTITIKTFPQDFTVFLNDIEYKSGEGILGVSPGQHIVKINQPNYSSIEDTIFVSKDKIYFEYKLSKLEIAKLTIQSNPKAYIILEGEAEGMTDKVLFKYPGKYRLKLSQEYYKTIDTIIHFTKEKSLFNFNLIRNTGFVKAITFPLEAQFKINGQQYTKSISHELEADKVYEISVTQDGYHPFDTIINLRPGANHTFLPTLERQSGKLLVSANPLTTKFKLIKGEEEVMREWEGSNIIDKIPTGNYTLNAKLKKHQTQNLPVVIKTDEQSKLDVQMYLLKRKKGSKFTAVFLSSIFPGGGQFYSGKGGRGLFYLFGTAAGVGGAYYFQQPVVAYNEAKTAYEEATGNFTYYREEMEAAWLEAEPAIEMRNYCVMAAGALYALNVLDALLFGKKMEVVKDKKVSLITVPVQNNVAMGVNLKF